MTEEICDPQEKCPSCDYLLENGGKCEGCLNDEAQNCSVTTSVETIEGRGPFSLDELNILFEARRTDKLEYLKNWSKAAVKYHEEEKGKLMKEWEKALEKIKELEVE